MRILITGGNGNISKMLKNKLFPKHDIASISRTEFDLSNYKELEKYLSDKEFDILIHTAIKGGRRTKSETGEVVYQNLLMFENLIRFENKFKLIINFDSAAIYDRSTDINNRKECELNTIPCDYYGFSKYLIYNRSLQYDKIINFRIFNIFHANEEPDRFITSCFLAKKNNTTITIFQNKHFDFVYENDFTKIVEHYIDNLINLNKLPKTINISYKKKYKLSEIAELILGNKQLIRIDDDTLENNYCGDGSLLNSLDIHLDGLETGIQNIKNFKNYC
jgi:nucleoside-diphosphate-sugar epimerase